METETDQEGNDPEYVRSPRKRRKQRRLSRNVDTCVVETPAASANCGNNPQLDRSQKKNKQRLDVQYQTDPSLCIICQKEK